MNKKGLKRLIAREFSGPRGTATNNMLDRTCSALSRNIMLIRSKHRKF